VLDELRVAARAVSVSEFRKREVTSMNWARTSPNAPRSPSASPPPSSSLAWSCRDRRCRLGGRSPPAPTWPMLKRPPPCMAGVRGCIRERSSRGKDCRVDQTCFIRADLERARLLATLEAARRHASDPFVLGGIIVAAATIAIVVSTAGPADHKASFAELTAFPADAGSLVDATVVQPPIPPSH
jgi:hypothetical protein